MSKVVLIILLSFAFAISFSFRRALVPLRSRIQWHISASPQGETQIDQALNDLFLRQLQEDWSPDISISRAKQSSKIMKAKDLVEVETNVQPGAPIEFIYKNRVSFGNYMSKNTGSVSVNIMTTAGVLIAVDPGQIISVWDDLADEEIPNNIESWAEVVSDALDIL